MEQKIPQHVAIIMDGNRRWATDKGLKPSQGHRKGADTLNKVGLYILNKGVKVLSVFAFSTENFKRSDEEVNYLMDLFVKMFKTEYKTFEKNNVKVIFSGRRDILREDVKSSMDKIVEKTKNNTNGILNICLNYGGMSEIVDATKKIVEQNISIEDINEDMFSNYLYQNLPPIDLLIRTSGEYRVSNFMLWQMAYAEFYFPKVHFPDFNETEFDRALEEFSNRKRRFGGNNNEDKNN